jgi:6-phosphogluconate dehydrogenase
MSCDIGIVGLAVMGSNLALNIAEKGFHVACYNRTYSRTEEFLKRAGPLASNLHGFEQLTDFCKALKVPRKVLILVQAGGPTDSTIKALCEVLEKNDVIVDTGNAHFKDQGRRAAELEALGLRFLGMGISGGEEGARKGPAFFPGGTLSVWEEIRPIIEAAAAKATDGRPCVTMNGKGGAGSCVKMFHNAGEYAILQIWGEVFDILREGGLTNDEIVAVLQSWKARKLLDSYMLDISIEVAKAKEGSKALTDCILDKIGSKGTGLWSAQEALEVGVPAPSLNAAVISRQFTMFKTERLANSSKLPFVANLHQLPKFTPEHVEKLYHATSLAIIASYAQMFQSLRELDKVYQFGLNFPATIATFRAGCILQGYMLQPMTRAFEEDPNLSNLLVAFSAELQAGLQGYRDLVALVTSHSAVAIPVLANSLVYINAMFQGTLRYGQMVSLQRDVFGRHGFERVDKEGKHNYNWPELQ